NVVPEHEQSVLQKQISAEMTEGVGEELIGLKPDELRTAIDAYLDKGVDFIKYGATTHVPPATIIFSDHAQRVLVEEAHKRGKKVSIHGDTYEGLRMAVEAGIDVVQHPEILQAGSGGPYSKELIRMYVERGVICALQSNFYTGTFKQ